MPGVKTDFIKQLSSNSLLKSCISTSLLIGSSTLNLLTLSHSVTTILSIPLWAKCYFHLLLWSKTLGFLTTGLWKDGNWCVGDVCVVSLFPPNFLLRLNGYGLKFLRFFFSISFGLPRLVVKIKRTSFFSDIKLYLFECIHHTLSHKS